MSGHIYLSFLSNWFATEKSKSWLMRNSSNFIFTIISGFVPLPLWYLNISEQEKCKSRHTDVPWWPTVTRGVCDSLRVFGGRCHTAWRSPPASGWGSHRCRPGRFHSSNLLTKHSAFHSGAFPQESRSHILTTSFHGEVNIPQSPAGLGSHSGTGWWEGLAPQTHKECRNLWML